MPFLARWAALAGTGLVALSLGGATSHAQSAASPLSYDCTSPAGAEKLAVRIKATFPESSTVGAVLQPSDVTVSAPWHGAVDGTADLTVETTQNGTASPVVWTGLPLRQSAETVTASGPVPAITPTSPGDLGFAASTLTLHLPSGPTTCTPEPGQNGSLASVRVTSAPTATPTPTATPYGCFVIPRPDSTWRQGCAFFTGFANVAKLGAAMGLNDSSAGDPVPIGVLYGYVGPQGETLDAKFKFVKPMTSRATFLAFNIMPVTATIELDQEGTGDLLDDTSTADNVISGSMRFTVRIFDVSQNGAPVPVGSNCHTSTPVSLDLAGVPGHPINNILTDPQKAIQSKLFTIPKFAGCGTGENLNPLINALVSGPGNRMMITLGRVAFADVKPPLPPPLRQ